MTSPETLAELERLQTLAKGNPGDKMGYSNEEATYQVAVIDSADSLLADSRALAAIRDKLTRQLDPYNDLAVRSLAAECLKLLRPDGQKGEL